MAKAKPKTDDVKEALRTKSPRYNQLVPDEDLLSCSSTLLNLACTGRIAGAFAKGGYYYFVGDSQSGKTWLTTGALAEAANNVSFDDYALIQDDTEHGVQFDVEHYFGKKLAKRIRKPKGGDSQYLEQFYDSLYDELDLGPCIYVLDSENTLKTHASHDKFLANKAARQKDKETKGEMSDGKAKIHSSAVRVCLPKLLETGSILLVISQTRDNINAGPFGPTKTRSGGRALTFYNSMEIWTSKVKTLKKDILGKKRQTGAVMRAVVKKNRAQGKERTVDINFYHSHGIDDVGSCIEYLISEGRWKKTGQKVKASDYDLDLSLENLIHHIEDNNMEADLFDTVQDTWDNIEEKTKVKRKPRYE